MVETITPVVHGGSRSRWAILVALHVAGATLAAAVFGAMLGTVGVLLDAPWGAAGTALVATLAGLYLAREALGLRVPVPQLRRQVPDWWRTFFPFAPAAFLYGVGLGVGFFTYLSHGTLVAVAASALASGRPLVGAALLAPFGFARGASAIVAMRSRTPEEASALVGRLAARASWSGWRIAHGAALAAVIGAALLTDPRIPSQPGSAAAAVLAIAFGAAAAVKLVDRRAWRRALASYRLPAPVERSASVAVPALELSVAALAVLGLARSAGIAAFALLAAFSAAIVVGRVRLGRRLDCGCFGAGRARDYRLLLARNLVLAAVAVVAWSAGTDAAVLGSVEIPSGADLVPATLVVLGIGLATWVAVQAVVTVRRGSRP
jgi:hypothetical protein